MVRKWLCGVLVALLIAGVAVVALAQEDTEAVRQVKQALTMARGDTQEATAIYQALGTWLAEHVKVTQGEKGDVLSVTLPNLKALKVTTAAYAGSDPGNYLISLYAGMAESISGAAANKKPLLIDPMPPAGAGEEDPQMRLLADALRAELLPACQSWMAKAFEGKKAYQALTRLALDAPEGVSLVAKQFGQKTALPGKVAAPRKTLKAGSSGNTVKAAQQALVAQGFLDAKVDGRYGDAMVEAVKAFEQEMGLTVDGSLTHEDMAVLYGEVPPMSMRADVAALNVRGVDLERWWPLMLTTMRDIKWTMAEAGKPVMHFTLPKVIYTHDEYALLEQMVDKYYAVAFTMDDLAGAIGGLIKADTKGERVEVSWPVSLDALCGVTGQAGLPSNSAKAMKTAFVSFYAPLSQLYDDMWQYGLDNLQPQLMPKNGVIMGKGGDSQFAIRNGGDFAIYVKLYRLENKNDRNTDNLAGVMMVHPGRTCKIKMQPGYYIVQMACGMYWYGDDLMFGLAGVYEASDEPFRFQKNYIHTLYIDVENAGGKPAPFSFIAPTDL